MPPLRSARQPAGYRLRSRRARPIRIGSISRALGCHQARAPLPQGYARPELPIVNSTLPNGGIGLLAYADADHAGDPVASKSTGGYLHYVDGILVLWKSKKQGLVAQSTMEVELTSTAEAWKNLRWIRDSLQEVGNLPEKAPIPSIRNENQVCILVLNSGNLSSDNRHMRLRFHHLVDSIGKHLLEVHHIEVLADGLTKPLGSVKHREFLKMLGLA